jgi:RimJ/RimL family protein N-acetyltransferase
MHAVLPEVKTRRLWLRRGAPEDFDAIHAAYSFPEVARMVATWPVPADPERTRRVCEALPVEEGIAGPILLGDTIIGNMGVTHKHDGVFGMGYGLHPDHWGKGYASEMGTDVISAVFARYPHATAIQAGVWSDNPASGRVLEKLGFRYTHTGFGYAVGREDVVEAKLYELTRAQWLAANPLHLETDRLIVRAFRSQDMRPLHQIVGQLDVARMTAAFPHPISLRETTDWALARKYKGHAGFAAGVFLKDGTLIGLTGISPAGASIMYAYHPDHWGQGYATEALSAFLLWAFEWFNIDQTTADHFHDNPASARVLAKLGFEKTGESLGNSKARLEPEPVIEYRLSRTRFESLS